MSAKRVSIGQVMMVVALAALNLALARAAPWDLILYPTIWVLLGSIDFVIIRKLILKRSLRAFHYTSLIVLVVAFVVMANLVATERLHPLRPLVHWYQHLAGENTLSISLGFLMIGEQWMAAFLSLLLGCAIGLVAAWLEKRRNWDIAAFLRGALIGVGIASLLSTVAHAAWGGAEPSSVLWIEKVIGSVFPIVGGLIGLSTLKSNSPPREDRSS
jgi:hypothetical protein